MQSWLPLFVIVASVSIILQTLILAAMFFQFRRQGRRVEQIAEEFRARVTPILGRVQVLVEDAQPKISSMLSDATEITRVARTQVQRVDRVMVEAVDRLRLQLVHADQILTGALETIEDTGAKLQKTLWGPGTIGERPGSRNSGGSRVLPRWAYASSARKSGRAAGRKSLHLASHSPLEQP